MQPKAYHDDWSIRIIYDSNIDLIARGVQWGGSGWGGSNFKWVGSC